MEHADLPVGVFGGDGGDDGGQQRLGKTAGCGENDRSQDDAGIGVLRPHGGKQRIDRKACYGDPRGGFDRFGDVEPVGEEGKQKIHAQLGHIIDQYQQTQTGVGNAVQRSECQKQYGREIGYHGHGDVCNVAGQFQALIIGGHSKIPAFFGSHWHDTIELGKMQTENGK